MNSGPVLVLFILVSSTVQAQMPANPPVRVEQSGLPAPRLAPPNAAERDSGSAPRSVKKPTPAEERLFRDFETSQKRQNPHAEERRKIENEKRQKLEEEKLFRDFQRSQRR
jgi:hypothetical protein